MKARDSLPSLMRLLRDLVNDGVNLARQEITLFRLEVAENLRTVGGQLGRVALGAGVLVIGVFAFAAFLIVGLGVLLGGRFWLSSLLVALILLAGGVGLMYLGARRLGSAFSPPRRTIDTLKDTGRWAGEEIGDLKAALAGDARPTERARLRRRSPGRVGTTSTSTEMIMDEALSGSGSRPRENADAPFHRRVLQEIGEDDVLGQAAKIAYYMFLSLPPALLVLFSLTGIFGGEQVATFLTNQIQGVLPGSADDPDSASAFVARFVDQVVNQNAPGPLSIGLVLGLWSSSAVFVAITEALNMAYDVEEDRSWFKRRAVAIAVMLAFVLLFLSGSVALIAGPQIARWLPFGDIAVTLWNILQWPVAFLLVVTAMFLVYYILPNRNQSASKWTLFKSAAVATALWLIATVGFRIYIANFGSYSETYGFLGASLVFLLWMYITGITILVGGEIGAEMERKA